MRLVIATLFTQGARNVPTELLPHVANWEEFQRAFCQVQCANGTFHGVLSRETLCDKAFLRLERFICRTFAAAKMYDDLGSFIEDLLKITQLIVGKRLVLHSSEIALFMMVLCFGLKRLLRDGSTSVPERKGSIESLRVPSYLTKALLMSPSAMRHIGFVGIG